MKRLTTAAELSDWLEERSDFLNGDVAWSTRPDGRVTLRLEENVQLGLWPGAEEIVDVYEMSADPVEFVSPEEQSAGHWIEDVEFGEADGCLFVETWVSGRLRLVADEFEVRRLATERRRTPPHPSDCEFGVLTKVPQPEAESWRQRVEELSGTDVVWRILGGGRRNPPSNSYDGWFLQESTRLESTTGGAFCRSVRPERVVFQNSGADADLWRAVLAASVEFGLEVWSGNCVFEIGDWARYLETGEFPPDERLRGDNGPP